MHSHRRHESHTGSVNLSHLAAGKAAARCAGNKES
jgi:hypothetical protein